MTSNPSWPRLQSSLLWVERVLCRLSVGVGAARVVLPGRPVALPSRAHLPPPRQPHRGTATRRHKPHTHLHPHVSSWSVTCSTPPPHPCPTKRQGEVCPAWRALADTRASFEARSATVSMARWHASLTGGPGRPRDGGTPAWGCCFAGVGGGPLGKGGAPPTPHMSSTPHPTTPPTTLNGGGGDG